MRKTPFSLLSFAIAASLASTAVAQIPNDDCTGAVPVVQGPNGPYSNFGSTTSFAWPCAAGGSDVWYIYVAPAAGPLTIDLCGSGFDTALELFDGNAGCGALVSLGCNDDSCGLQSSVSVANVNQGDVVYARVGGFASQTGTFTVNVNGPIAPGQVVATATPYGNGCVNLARATIYEYFDMTNGPTFDLSNTAIMFVPTGTGYLVMPTASTWYTPTSANLGLGDDQVSAALPLGFTLNYPGGSTTDVYASSNGFVWAQADTNSGCCSGYVPDLLAQGARWCALWNDLNPSAGGTVHFDTDPINGVAYVTFVTVPEYGTANPNTFQYAFFNTGVVEIRWQSCTITQPWHHVIVGWTPGNTLDPGSIDFSSALPRTTYPDARALVLSNTGRPLVGVPMTLDTSNITPAAFFGAVGLGLTNPNLPLDPLGMPGCTQYTDLLATLLFLPLGSPTASVVFVAPPALNLHIFTQSFVFDPAAGTTLNGAVASNGLDLGIGNL